MVTLLKPGLIFIYFPGFYVTNYCFFTYKNMNEFTNQIN